MSSNFIIEQPPSAVTFDPLVPSQQVSSALACKFTTEDKIHDSVVSPAQRARCVYFLINNSFIINDNSNIL